MAVVLIEGFDETNDATALASKGWSGCNIDSAKFVTGRFSFPGSKAVLTQVSNAVVGTKILPGTYTTFIIGFAFQLPSGNWPSTTDYVIISAGGTKTFRFGFDGSNHIQIVDSAGTAVAAGTTVIGTNQWYYVEIKCVIAGASGSVEVHLNGNSGSPEIPATTHNFGSSNLDRVVVSAPSSSNIIEYDDVYGVDTTGADNNTFLGDVAVATIFPNADGTHSAWTPTGGGAHYTQVDDDAGTYPDGDATYVSSLTVGALDSYAFSDIDGGATVYAVQVCINARKDDANTRQIAPLIRQGGTDFAGTTVTLAATYSYFPQLYDKDPNGVAWTATNVNADEFGVKEIA